MELLTQPAEISPAAVDQCEASPALHAPASSSLRLLLLAASLLLVFAFLFHAVRQNRDFSISEDESHDAVTGLFFADLLVDRPLAHPLAYTYSYYARYPALGLIHWPPVFHVSEGIMFLIAGRSVQAARFTTVLFALLGLGFWFAIVDELLNPFAAAFATVLLGLLPWIFLYEQSAMLEIPALAMCIATTYFWIVFLRRKTTRSLYLFALCLGLALLTKQHSGYLLIFCALSLSVERKWELLWNRRTLGAALLAAVLVVPYYVLVLKMHGHSIAQQLVGVNDHPTLPVTLAAKIKFYGRTPLSELGWPLLVMSVIGIFIFMLRGKRRDVTLMTLWILACYLSFTFLRVREARFVIYAVPPLIYFASWFLVPKYSRRSLRYLAGAIAIATVTFVAVKDWKANPYVPLSGYASLAQRVTQIAGGKQVVLFDGEGDGNFIFYLRVNDPARRFVVVRKALYATEIIPEFGRMQLLDNSDQIRQLLSDYGIRYLIVSDRAQANLPIQQKLRELIRTPQFAAIETFPIYRNNSQVPEQSFTLYRNLESVARKTDRLKVKMMTLDRDIDVPFAELGSAVDR